MTDTTHTSDKTSRVYEGSSPAQIEYMSKAYKDGGGLKPPFYTTNSKGGSLTINYHQMGFNIGVHHDSAAMGDVLYGLLGGLMCANRPEAIDTFLYFIANHFESGRGRKTDIKFLEGIWLNGEDDE